MRKFGIDYSINIIFVIGNIILNKFINKKVNRGKPSSNLIEENNNNIKNEAKLLPKLEALDNNENNNIENNNKDSNNKENNNDKEKN